MKHLSALLLSSLLVVVYRPALNGQTTHDIQVLDDEFQPSTLTIQLGDAVHLDFVDPDHTFTQVTQVTWLSDENTPMPGGYRFGVGTPNPGTDFTFTPTVTGMIFYVCEFHVDMGMKGTINVVGGTGIAENTNATFLIMPDPANDHVVIRSDIPSPMSVAFYDATGQVAKTVTVASGDAIPVADLNSGMYFVEVRDQGRHALGTQRISIVR